MTVNCARLVKPDQHATNGIVHVVDRVITAVSNNMQSVIDIDDDLETLRVSASNLQSWFHQTTMNVVFLYLLDSKY